MLRSKILYETLSAQYTFLWNDSLADPEALEAAYDRMIEDGACYERTPVKPITSSKRYSKNFDLTCAKFSTQANGVFAALLRLAPLR